MAKKNLTKWEKLQQRLTDKLFLTAVAAGVYQILEKYGHAPGAGDYQLWVDILTYAIIGGGIYKTFDK